jgi:hypothetical protein
MVISNDNLRNASSLFSILVKFNDLLFGSADVGLLTGVADLVVDVAGLRVCDFVNDGLVVVMGLFGLLVGSFFSGGDVALGRGFGLLCATLSSSLILSLSINHIKIE